MWGDVGFVDTVWIVSTGSTSRPGLQEIQNLTIGRHFRLITFTEANVDACVLCAPGAATDAPPDPNMKKREGGARGWWCAQKRILPALAAVLRSQPALEFPAFLMLIDDDTAVNPQALLRHTAALDPGVPLYATKRCHFPLVTRCTGYPPTHPPPPPTTTHTYHHQQAERIASSASS